MAATEEEGETTGEEGETTGGGAPGRPPALGATFGAFLGPAASPLVLAVVLLVVARFAWQILQLVGLLLWWCSPQVAHSHPFFGFLVGSSGGATTFTAPQLRHFGVLELLWWSPQDWQNHPWV